MTKTEVIKKPNWLKDKIETKEFALEIIKQVSQGFYGLAVIQGVMGYFIVGFYGVFEAIIIALLATWLIKSRSKISAGFIFAYSIASFASTTSNYFVGTGGRNIVLAVICVIMSYRAYQATKFLNS